MCRRTAGLAEPSCCVRPLALRRSIARYAYMYLADRLAGAGLACFRFDYDGTGDSAGQQNDPDRVEAWLDSIRRAMELVRGLGTNRISVVGLRMGATLLAETFGSGPAAIDDLVLWDSCASGRSFLREQSALWAFALGAERCRRWIDRDTGSRLRQRNRRRHVSSRHRQRRRTAGGPGAGAHAGRPQR